MWEEVVTSRKKQPQNNGKDKNYIIKRENHNKKNNCF